MKKHFILSILSLLCILFFNYSPLKASDSTYIVKVEILHGSKPAPGYEKQEHRWLGGMLGGHVVMVLGDDVYGFGFRKHQFHWLTHRQHPSGEYQKQSLADWQRKTAHGMVTTFEIPVTAAQYHKLHRLYEQRLAQCPYDYAFLGVRCAASAYEMLSYIGVFPQYSRQACIAHIFYPDMLRHKLHHMAALQGWAVDIRYGCCTRVWQK